MERISVFPRVAFALGLTLGLMYPRELERANRIPDPKAKEQKKAEIDKEFKQPALLLIKEGSSAVEAPEFVEGLIAFLDKRYNDALKRLKSLFKNNRGFSKQRNSKQTFYAQWQMKTEKSVKHKKQSNIIRKLNPRIEKHFVKVQVTR